jgi:hypothetical protein
MRYSRASRCENTFAFRATFSTLIVGPAGTGYRTRATCVADSGANRSAIHYDLNYDFMWPWRRMNCQVNSHFEAAPDHPRLLLFFSNKIFTTFQLLFLSFADTAHALRCGYPRLVCPNSAAVFWEKPLSRTICRSDRYLNRNCLNCSPTY